MEQHLHIVCHDVPWPVDYGGVTDPFYTIKTLHQSGIRIHLHCFTSGRKPASMLERYCESVEYYQRTSGLSAISLRLPYIVSSRSNRQLINRLQEDNHPILLQGIHCTFPVLKNCLGSRKVLVRLFNVESEYYRNLYRSEKNQLKRVYFFCESRLLETYERQLPATTTYACLSETDADYYKKHLLAEDAHFLPAFVPWNKVSAEQGMGTYCLYHGNLSVSENERAALWLLENIFAGLEIPFVIAGKNPSKKLVEAAHVHKHTCIVENPSEHEMEDLIRKAQINILPSFNNTGVKLKLLHALFTGRHCIVNQAGVKGSGVESIVHTAETKSEYTTLISQLFNKPLGDIERKEREQKLATLYSNQANAEKLIRLLY